MLALLLIAGEVLLPGYFLLWIGIAAAAMGAIVLVVPALGLLAQAVCFAVLAFLSCIALLEIRAAAAATRSRAGSGAAQSPRRAMIGQRYVLDRAIVNGRGKARVGDGQWLVEGPDLPVGTAVEVIGVEGTTLKVRPAA